MIERGRSDVSISRQCQLVQVSRSSVYYVAKPVTAEELELRRRIDEIYLEHPFMGSRQIVRTLARKGLRVNRKRVQRLMRAMGLQAIVPGPHTSIPRADHKKYPYLLRGLDVNRPNQVWASDITYIPMTRGFLFLVAIMDWHSRRVLAWRLSNTLDSSFCLEALAEALKTHGVPEIFNTDQGAQYTSELWIQACESRGIRVSMDGKGRALDNVFIERLWRTLKYEQVYPTPAANGHQLEEQLRTYFTWYNDERPHSSLGDSTPSEAHSGHIDAFAQRGAA
jgi:putative transposase